MTEYERRREEGGSGELENGSFNFNLNSSYLTFGHRNLSLYSIRPFSSSSSSFFLTWREARSYVHVQLRTYGNGRRRRKRRIKRGYSARDGSFLPHGWNPIFGQRTRISPLPSSAPLPYFLPIYISRPDPSPISNLFFLQTIKQSSSPLFKFYFPPCLSLSRDNARIVSLRGEEKRREGDFPFASIKSNYSIILVRVTSI